MERFKLIKSDRDTISERELSEDSSKEGDSKRNI